MGLILDSSVLIAAERNGDSIAQILDRIFSLTGNQETAISSIALVEWRTEFSEQIRRRGARNGRCSLTNCWRTYPSILHACDCNACRENRCRAVHEGVKIPFQDLLIGATALDLGYAVVTGNMRHFKIIPGLTVIGL